MKKGESGDLYVHVNVSTHEKFERNGSDIYSVEQINVSQAVLGDKIHVDTLDGKIELKIPSGMQSGKKLRLSGKGMSTIGRSNKRGDHIITVSVLIPTNLSKEQEELFEKLKNSLD